MNHALARPMKRQRGAALFVAIFLITVVVLVVAVITLTSVTQHTGQARASEAAAAWYAAMARLEAEIPAVLASDNCPPGGDAAVFGFTTELACTRQEVSEGSETYAVFSLEARARRGSQSASTLVRRTARTQIAGTEP